MPDKSLRSAIQDVLGFIRHALASLERREATQRVIAREGIVEEGRLQRRQIETLGEGPRLVRRQLDQALAQN